ncbi:hypothetical protein Val02_12970 [Virgisporangium aliadipatigenens]|uniref:Uncharacterized protein n=1 Tax=Virgisporangium aliadipatigenens TaxID=741659 RepID=A0A8J4DP14_9ACTN|nr:hypothetical protein [Virgisporangium aliadipatigenens]GIJ44411.1 hypothetical protein Val02_12970 [Virgisporangium aliadipatigenens]
MPRLYTVDNAHLTAALRARSPSEDLAGIPATGGGPVDGARATRAVRVVEALGTYHGEVDPDVFPAARGKLSARVLARYGPIVDLLVTHTPERMTLAGLTFGAPWRVTRLDPTEARTAAVVAASAVHPMEPDLVPALAALESAVRAAAAGGLLVIAIDHL